MIKEIEIIKNKFNLLPHPEGGYYKETYRGQDSCCTGIFYLLGEGQQSKLHKINSDEMWHFYKGDPLILVIVNDSKLTQITLGNDFEAGHECQYVVKAGDWFGAFTPSGSKYSLVGCTVSPGFQFADLQFPTLENVQEIKSKLISTSDLEALNRLTKDYA